MSKDSQREINRVKNTLTGAGKGQRTRTHSVKMAIRWPECADDRCHRMKMRGSDYCSEHQQQMEKSKNG